MSKLRAVQPEAVQKRLKALFYGKAGAGKTTAAISFPKVYYIDTEKGGQNSQYVKILKDRGAAVFQTSDFDELLQEVKTLLTEKHEFKTLVIDPFTIMYDDLLEKSAANIRATSKEKDATGTEFGRHYSDANKKTKNLLNLLLRLDMNVIITSHAKNEYGDNMKVIGTTFDCYKKLDYLFDLVFEVQKRGKEHFGIVKKSRLEEFNDSEQFPFSYDEIAKRYGKDILEKDSIAQELASEEQVREIKRLIDLIKVPEEDWQKWLDKASSASWDEMPSATIQKCIDHLVKKLQGDK